MSSTDTQSTTAERFIFKIDCADKYDTTVYLVRGEQAMALRSTFKETTEYDERHYSLYKYAHTLLDTAAEPEATQTEAVQAIDQFIDCLTNTVRYQYSDKRSFTFGGPSEVDALAFLRHARNQLVPPKKKVRLVTEERVSAMENRIAALEERLAALEEARAEK